jgi:tRNA(Ile)-lysidine synthase TilS/MesJ
LLTTPKEHIRAYARQRGLEWHEDSTNASTDYLRNYVRQTIMPKFDERAKAHLRRLIEDTRAANVQIDSLLAEQLHLQPAGDMLDRQWFTMLPHAVAKEIMATWLRRLGIAGFDRRLIERLVVAAKTLAPGKQVDINGRYVMLARREHLAVVPRNR